MLMLDVHGSHGNNSYHSMQTTDYTFSCNPCYMKESIGERIRRLRTEASLSQQKVADAVGVSRVAVTKWESGQTRDMRHESLMGLAKLFGISLDELLSGMEPSEYPSSLSVETRGFFVSANPAPPIGTPIMEWEKPEDLPEGEVVIVPRYDLHVAAGNGHVVYEEMEHEQGQAYRTNSIRKLGSKASNLMTVYAKGDSMEPSIYAGDALLVDRGQREVQDRNVYVLRYGHEIRVKRLFKRPDGGLRIVSDNTNGFPEEVVTAVEMEHIEIIGRVVERSGRM